MTNFPEERGNPRVNVNQGSSQGINITIASIRSKERMNSTKATIIKKEEGPLHFRKRKGVGNTHKAKEQSLSKRWLRKRKFTLPQQYEASRIGFEKKNQLATRDPLGPNRKQSREAIGTVESQLKPLTRPRKLTKAKNSFLPQLSKIREESSCLKQNGENIIEGVYSTIISENEKDTSNLQNKELIHSKNSSNFEVLSSKHIKSKTKRRSVNIRRSHNSALDKTRTRKTSLKEKHRNGSHGLHSLSNPNLPRKIYNRLQESACITETSDGKEQPEGIQNKNRTLDIRTDRRKNFQSKATATALKLANDTSGFVRTTLKAVKDSRNFNVKMKDDVSKKRKEDVNMDNEPNGILTTIATRYKSTLETLQRNKTLTAEKLIEELGAIHLDSEGNETKTGRLGKRHRDRSTRSTFKKHLKDGPIERDNLKEIIQPNAIDDKKSDVRDIKLGRKARKNIENQMRRYGIIEKVAQNQGFNAGVATKKSKSVMASGFDRLISGASKNKEFESALAEIVSSHDNELGWTEDQVKTLQNAYLSIKQTDGDFWHLISKEVPGRSAKECYDKFYSRQPTHFAKAQAPPTTTCPNEFKCPPSLSNPLNTKSKVTSHKATKNPKQLAAQKTIHKILGHVDNMEGYKTKNSTMENDYLNTMQDVGSKLDRVDDERAVILQSNPMKEYNNVAPTSHVEEGTHSNHAKTFFENVVISGVGERYDKENNQPPNGQEVSHKKLGVPRVELILKSQVENGEYLPCDNRPKTTCNTGRKKKIIKTNNIYLHSKDALDFGDTTLDAIQCAKQELRNVFSRTGSSGGNFFDIDVNQIDA